MSWNPRLTFRARGNFAVVCLISLVEKDKLKGHGVQQTYSRLDYIPDRREKFGLDCKHFVLYLMNKKLTHMFTLAREVRIQWKPALWTPAYYAYPYTFNGQFHLT